MLVTLYLYLIVIRYTLYRTIAITHNIMYYNILYIISYERIRFKFELFDKFGIFCLFPLYPTMPINIVVKKNKKNPTTFWDIMYYVEGKEPQSQV